MTLVCISIESEQLRAVRSPSSMNFHRFVRESTRRQEFASCFAFSLSFSDRWFPTLSICAFPQFLAGGIVDELAGFGIALHDGIGAIGNIAEVTEHRALLPF